MRSQSDSQDWFVHGCMRAIDAFNSVSRSEVVELLLLNMMLKNDTEDGEQPL